MGALISKITDFAKRNGTHAALGIVVYLVVQKVLAKLRNRPPRPMAVPLLGNLYLLPQPGEAPGVHKAMWGLVKKFGPSEC